MSYITFDFKCSHCGNVDSRFVKREEMDNQTCEHEGLPSWHQPSLMTRLPAATRTTFKFADTKLKD